MYVLPYVCMYCQSLVRDIFVFWACDFALMYQLRHIYFLCGTCALIDVCKSYVCHTFWSVWRF
jgi:hypothetical protein